MFRRNKKGTIDDLPFILGVVFMMFLLGIIVYKVWDKFADENAFGKLSTEGKEVQDIVTYNTLPNIDYWVAQVVFFGSLVILILAFLVRSHPIFIPIALVIIIILTFVTHALSDAAIGILNNPTFAQEKDALPITYFIMDKLEIIFLLISSMVLIVTYAFFGGEAG